MQQENEDKFVHIMATEKVVNMLFTIEQALNFMYEYNVKPDDQFRSAIKPAIDELQDWIKDEKI